MLHEIDEDDDDEEAAPSAAAEGQADPAPEAQPAKEKEPDELTIYSEEELADFDTDQLKAEIALLEGGCWPCKQQLMAIVRPYLYI